MLPITPVPGHISHHAATHRVADGHAAPARARHRRPGIPELAQARGSGGGPRRRGRRHDRRTSRRRARPRHRPHPPWDRWYYHPRNTSPGLPFGGSFRKRAATPISIPCSSAPTRWCGAGPTGAAGPCAIRSSSMARPATTRRGWPTRREMPSTCGRASGPGSASSRHPTRPVPTSRCGGWITSSTTAWVRPTWPGTSMVASGAPTSRSPSGPAAGTMLPDPSLGGVAVHEVGHAVGLPHSADTLDIMFPSTHARLPSPRDRRSVLLLYRLPPGQVRELRAP